VVPSLVPAGVCVGQPSVVACVGTLPLDSALGVSADLSWPIAHARIVLWVLFGGQFALVALHLLDGRINKRGIRCDRPIEAGAAPSPARASISSLRRCISWTSIRFVAGKTP